MFCRGKSGSRGAETNDTIRNLDRVDKADGLGEIDGLLVEVLVLDLIPLGEEGVEAED